MSLQSAAAEQRLRAALYVAPSERMDGCARCRDSRPSPSGDELRCLVHRGPVRNLGICALWRPMSKWVPA
jgi:hypothetical protein